MFLMALRRVISILMILAFILQFDAISSMIDIKSSAYDCFYETKNEESTKEANNPQSLTGTWSNPKSDNLVPPYSYFHEQVQNHIIAKNTLKSKKITKEHVVTYKEGFVPNNNSSGKGRVDLYYENEKKAFFWEVKPGSYIVSDKLKDAKDQLNGYITNTILPESITENRNGNKGYADKAQEYLQGDMNFEQVFEMFKTYSTTKFVNEFIGLLSTNPQENISFDFFTDTSGKYTILTAYLEDGIILYWFMKIPQNRKKEEVCEPVDNSLLARYWWLAGVPLTRHLSGDKTPLPSCIYPNSDESLQFRLFDELSDEDTDAIKNKLTGDGETQINDLVVAFLIAFTTNPQAINAFNDTMIAIQAKILKSEYANTLSLELEKTCLAIKPVLEMIQVGDIIILDSTGALIINADKETIIFISSEVLKCLEYLSLHSESIGNKLNIALLNKDYDRISQLIIEYAEEVFEQIRDEIGDDKVFFLIQISSFIKLTANSTISKI